MAKAEFKGYGGVVDHFEHEMGKIAPFVEKSGGPVDAFGDEEKKEKSAIDMNAAEAFNKKSYTEVDASGTEMPKKSGRPGQFCDNKGDHFKVGEVDPSGNDAGKKESYQTSTRK